MSKTKLLAYDSSSSNTNTSDPPLNNEIASQSKRPRVEFSHMDIIGDPGERKPIENYPLEIRDQIKRAYALSGPTQPDICIFPRKWQSGEWRSFQKTWLNEFNWLEYSVSKDAVYCLYCYLFFQLGKPEKFGSVVFAKEGYVNWKKDKDRLAIHSNCKTHNDARKKCEDFMNQRTSVSRKIEIVTKEEEIRYKIRITSSLDVIRFLIEQGDPFRGHDETNASLNKCKFREMVNLYKDKVPQKK